MTDEDTGSTGKTTKRKSTAAKPRSASKPRSKSAAAKTGATKRSTAKAAPAKAASTKSAAAKSAAPAKTSAQPAAKSAPASTSAATKTEAPKAASTPPAATAAAKPAAAAAAAPAASAAAKPAASSSSTGSGGAGSGSSGGGSGGSSGGGSSYTPPPPRSDDSSIFSLPVILSVAAIIIAILIPTLSGPPSAPPAPKVDLAAMQTKQAELTAAVAELQAGLDAMAAQQEAMETSIAAVKVPAVLIAASDLHEAISTGEPFTEALHLFQAIVGSGTEAVASVFALEPLAETGVPTEQELQVSFGEVSHEVIAAFQTVESEGDLARRVSETMANLTAATTRLRWRLDGTVAPEGTSPLAIMARAETAAEAGDFDLVIAELEALPEELKEMTTGWVEQVAAQKEAAQAVEDLDLFMIETVAAARQ